MALLNPIKQPIEEETLDAWAKMSDDIAKVSLLAIPVVIFGEFSPSLKVINTIFLIISVYTFILGSRNIRLKKNKEN